MAILDLFKKKKVTHKKFYNAAKTNRLNQGWGLSVASADASIRKDLVRLRSRSRDLAANNDYVRKFFRMVRANVIGSEGITLQSKVLSENLKSNLRFDKNANDKIEKAFKEWGKKKNTSVDGRLSWIDIQQLIVETVARDGEVLVRKIKGNSSGNDFGFALQVLEADHLKEDYNLNLSNGNYIRMGIEYNSWSKPVAYHLYETHPGDDFGLGRNGKRNLIKIPAEEIIHLFITERPSQSRGIPWIVSAMTRFNMLGGYEEAEVTAARIGASKMGFYTNTTEPDEVADLENQETGELLKEVEPGVLEALPPGIDFKEFNTDHPNNNYGNFVKSILRGAAAGLGVSYNGLANDLEGVNFSSLRQGYLWDRDFWRVMQKWVVEHFCEEIFEEWLLFALTSQKIELPLSKFNKFNSAEWMPRGWSWIDPEKEAKANILEIGANLRTAASVASERGSNIEDIMAGRAEEIKMEEEFGIRSTIETEKLQEKILNEETKEEEENGPEKKPKD